MSRQDVQAAAQQATTVEQAARAAEQAGRAAAAAAAQAEVIEVLPGDQGIRVQNGSGGNAVIRVPGAATPQALYEAARNKRDELEGQLEELRETRTEISDRLRHNPDITGADRTGLERQITELDARIATLDKAMAEADAQVATAAGVPGAIVPPPPPPPRDGPPEEVFIIPIVFTIFVLFPLAVAYSRRIWKRTGMAVAAIPTAVQERLARLEQNVDTIAIEVERISEGQRFMTKLFSDNAGRVVGAGVAQPIEVGARERAAEQR